MRMTSNYSYLFPVPFSHLNRTASLCVQPNLSMDVIQPALSQPFQNRIHHNMHISAKIKKIPDPSIPLLSPLMHAPVRNLGVIFDPLLSFSNRISNLSRS